MDPQHQQQLAEAITQLTKQMAVMNSIHDQQAATRARLEAKLADSENQQQHFAATVQAAAAATSACSGSLNSKRDISKLARPPSKFSGESADWQFSDLSSARTWAP
jgi:hypothetical protein